MAQSWQGTDLSYFVFNFFVKLNHKIIIIRQCYLHDANIKLGLKENKLLNKVERLIDHGNTL